MSALSTPAESLSQAFLRDYPSKSASFLQGLPPDEAANTLQNQPLVLIVQLWPYLPPGTSEQILLQLPQELSVQLLAQLDVNQAASLLNRLADEPKGVLMQALPKTTANEIEDLLTYPEDTAARLMKARVNAFSPDIRASQALNALKSRDLSVEETLYVVDQQQQLLGEIDLASLIKAKPDTRLKHIMSPIKTVLGALDSKDEVIEKFEGYRANAIAVLDAQKQLIGVIRFSDVYQHTKEDLASDMQTMVGASADERALSSAWFAVKKRMPWLQINLLTAFAAAAVVGAFEGLIAEITALAILLPVAAGQSGNAGAQALAVTMRGLTLREITLRHWPQVLMKEVATGLLNGLAIAVTCSIGVYVWSESVGLALVIALAMVSSLVIACGAGAVVPIMLKRFGMDPAQSSSIVLTTITDIAGFMSFLGIALLLVDMLPKG